MSSKGTRKSWPTAIGGAIVAIVAAYFGLDLSGGDSGTGNGSGTDTTTQAEQQRDESTSSSGLPTCEVASLPDQADMVVDDILAGGPFEYPDRDGTRFGNYEGILPKESGNYYREYTVETPGLNHRGERRIVTGGGSKTDPDVWFYTDDHYESFCEIPDAEN